MDESLENRHYNVPTALLNSAFHKDEDSLAESLFIKINEFTLGGGKRNSDEDEILRLYFMSVTLW